MLALVERAIEEESSRRGGMLNAREAARVAIAAMRDPSDDLLRRAGIIDDDSGAPYCSEWHYFRTQIGQMIDAALSQESAERERST